LPAVVFAPLSTSIALVAPLIGAPLKFH